MLEIYFTGRGSITIPQFTDWELKDGFVFVYNEETCIAIYNAAYIFSVVQKVK